MDPRISFYCQYPHKFLARLFEKAAGRPSSHFRASSLAASMPDSPVIIEAGASRGMDTVELAAIWPQGRVFAFEPEPASFAALVSAAGHLPNVECVPLALSSSTGRAAFHVSHIPGNAASADASSLLPPEEVRKMWPTLQFDHTLDVETITLSEFLRRQDIPRVDFMWLDMQGMEMECLQASSSVMHRVDRVYCEVFLRPLYARAPLYREAKKIMHELGFKVSQEYLRPVAGDVLFVRRGVRC